VSPFYPWILYVLSWYFIADHLIICSANSYHYPIFLYFTIDRSDGFDSFKKDDEDNETEAI